MRRLAPIIVDAFRLAARRMCRSPMAALAPISVVALTTFALTLILGLVQGVLLKPLPYPDSARLLHVGWQPHPGHDGSMNLTESAATFLAGQPDLFASITKLSDPGTPVVLGRGSEVHAAPALRADAAFLPTLGLAPPSGRGPTAEEIATRLPQVLVSPALWSRHFGAQPFSPKQIDVEGVPHTVLGLLPADFRFDPPVDVVLPWAPGGVAAQGHNTVVIARLNRDVDLAATQALLAARVGPVLGDFGGSVSPGATAAIRLRPLHTMVVGDASRLLLPLAGALGLLVVLAALNLANLQLAGLMARRAEVTMRGALGAEPWMLRLPGVAEATLRVGIGVVAGLTIAVVALPAALARLPFDLPRLSEVGLDPQTVASVVGVALLFLALCLLITGLGERASANAIRGGNRSSRLLGWQPGLVAAQVALSTTLLAGALMSVGSLESLLTQDRGYRVEGVTVASLLLPEGRYGDAKTASANTERDLALLGEELQRTPGVLEVASSSSPPLSRGLNNWVVARGKPVGEAGASVEMRIVSPGYLDVLGARLIAGRDFADGDVAGAPVVAIVNQRFAEQLLPSGAALGARIELGGIEHEVIGISADLREQSLRDEALPTVLVAQAQTDPALQAAVNRWFGANLLVSTAPSVSVESALDRGLGAIGHAAVLQQVRPLSELESASVSRERLVASLLGGFTALALALAGIGLYALLEHLRREREHELAVRLALGARAGQNARLLLLSHMKLTAIGLGLGVVGSVVLSRGIAHLLYGSESLITASIGLAVLGVLGLALLTALRPVLDALGLHPSIALRS